jgi:alkylation response protein AidB-like acyl-CoA dehydrogenase
MSAIGRTLSVLNRLAGSELVDRFGLRGPAQVFAYRAVKNGLTLSNAAARKFQAVSKLTKPARLAAPPSIDRFDLNLTEDQRLIQETAERVAREQFRPQAIKAEAACATPAETLSVVRELGLAEYSIPEALGGAGHEHSPITSILVAEALAHGDMGMAIAALSSIGAINALVRYGSAAQQSQYLPAFLEETPATAAIALLEPEPLFDPFELRTRAELQGSDYVINGRKALTPIAASADLLLVSAEVPGKGPQMFVLERGSEGIQATAEAGMGIRSAALGRIELRNVRVPASALLGGEVDACSYQELVDLSRLAWCALAIGTSRAVLDYVIPYCNERIAFGEPISNRQSVAFMISNIAIELDAMRLLTLRAASRAEQGLSFHQETYLARVLCADKAMEIGTNGVQLLGGHGFVKDHPVERWYRDLRSIAIMEGALLA